MIMIATELCVGGSLEHRLRSYKQQPNANQTQTQPPSHYQNTVDSDRYVNTSKKLYVCILQIIFLAN